MLKKVENPCLHGRRNGGQGGGQGPPVF